MSPPLSNSQELLIQVSDDDHQILGPVERRRVHGNPDLIHRAVHILVVNSDGLLLLQKRSLQKDTQPGKWDTSVGGHVGFGQSYEEAGLREAEEEIGLVLKSRDLEHLYFSKIRNEVESENIETYLCRHDGPFVPQPEEIDELRFWSRGEIQATLGTGLFTSNFEEEFAAFVASPWGALLK